MGETRIRSTIVGVEGGRADERFILNGTAKPHIHTGQLLRTFDIAVMKEKWKF